MPIITHSLLSCIVSPLHPTLASCVIAAAHVSCPYYLVSATRYRAAGKRRKATLSYLGSIGFC